MKPKSTTLYNTLGGHEVMVALVDDFYARVLADARIGHYFEHMNMDRQREHQAAFISQVLGGPEQYSGRSMVEAHAGLDLRKADFDAVASHLEASLEALGVEQTHIDTVMSRIAKLEREILYNRSDAKSA